MTDRERAAAWLASQRVGRLATVDADGLPHVVPVCFALRSDCGVLYVTIDEKPKRDSGRPLQRIRNLHANPNAALVADHYAEDWSQLGWVMVRGQATILADGAEHDAGQALLRAKYPQYRAMALAPLPVIALRIGRWSWWGQIGG